jgi:hypothetical protein
MDLTEGSKTSANINQTPEKHPKVDTLNTEHGESLKSRTMVSSPVTIDSKLDSDCDSKASKAFGNMSNMSNGVPSELKKEVWAPILH